MPQKVKKLDDMIARSLIEHVGWRLWQASQIWQNRFRRGMVDAGYPWFNEARATMVPYIGRAGSRQSDLAARSGLTKQAVQQLIDALVRDGVVERSPDPDDARGRLVYFTAAGMQLLADANVVKQRIEQEFNSAIGAAALARLNTELARLISSDAENQEPAVPNQGRAQKSG